MKSTIDSFVAGGLAALLWLAPTGIVHPADDYLSVLEVEAGDNRWQGERTSATNNTVPVKHKNVRAATSLKPDLDFEGFEQELRSSYSGTHLLYMSLPRNQQRAAWKSYLDNNDLRTVRENIVSMLSSD